MFLDESSSAYESCCTLNLDASDWFGWGAFLDCDDVVDAMGASCPDDGVAEDF